MSDITPEMEEYDRQVDGVVQRIPAQMAAASEASLEAHLSFTRLEQLGDVELFDGVEGRDALHELAEAMRHLRNARRIAEHRAGLSVDNDEDLSGEARCRVCGCTESQACEGGCHWVPDPQMGDLCSRCVPDSAPAWIGEVLDQWNASELTPHDAMTAILNRLTETPDDGPEGASDIGDDDPKTWTDGQGRVWDLRFKYADRLGNLWHYAGGFEYPAAGVSVPLLSRDDWSIQDVRLTAVEAQWGPLAIPKSDGEQDTSPAAYPTPGSEIPGQPGYVVGTCGHRVAGSEWRAGFKTCERCPHKVGDQA